MEDILFPKSIPKFSLTLYLLFIGLYESSSFGKRIIVGLQILLFFKLTILKSNIGSL